jgi:hypothetical protein
VKTGREGICSLVSCASGREGVVSFGVDARRWEEGKNEKKTLKSRQAGDPTRSSGNPYTASARDTAHDATLSACSLFLHHLRG